MKQIEHVTYYNDNIKFICNANILESSSFFSWEEKTLFSNVDFNKI